MTPTPTIVRALRRGIPVWLDVTSGRWFPIIAGADGTDDTGTDDGQAGDGQDSGDDAGSDEQGDDDEADEAADDDATRLKAALEKERKARRAAEKRARDAERKTAKPDKPKPKADDDAGDEQPDRVTLKLRRANLKAALADEGITGQQAKAAMRLIDGVDYDDDDEPANLADALKAAEETFGKAAVRGTTKPTAPKADGGAGGATGDEQGPKLTADELEYAKAFGMSPEEYARHKATQPAPAKK